MDSQHRHELEQNDLVVFLTHFNEWWAKYGQITLIVILVVVGTFTGTRYYQHNKMMAHENAWGGLARSTSPESYRATAADNEGAVKALAYLRGADLLLAQATVPQTPAKPVEPVEVTEADATTVAPAVIIAPAQTQDPREMLADAKIMYQAVANDKSVHVVLQINAFLGLGSIAESQNQWDQAAQAYDQAVALAGTRYHVLTAQASNRKKQLDDIKSPVKFVKAIPVAKPKFSDIDAGITIKAPNAKLDLSSPVVLPGMSEDKPAK
ncbi:MAG: tetratricopeptide repeat-containing protein [Phycisphaeraceae bacterium]|nr:tetratricopeptide repeat-containing protein [Phycisphaeraceae bacterium]